MCTHGSWKQVLASLEIIKPLHNLLPSAGPLFLLCTVGEENMSHSAPGFREKETQNSDQRKLHATVIHKFHQRDSVKATQEGSQAEEGTQSMLRVHDTVGRKVG
jgi:hypothetical protein